jgi:uncharacterized protein DUF5990
LKTRGLNEGQVERELTLRIVLEKPPGGIDFGLQKGKGSLYDIAQTQRSRTASDLSFEFIVRVGESEKKEPNFLGPYVQGPSGGRFVYINIGTYAGQKDSPWSRRLKVPLQGITWKMVDAGMLETRVPGTGRDGGPTCATVKPFEGWKAV